MNSQNIPLYPYVINDSKIITVKAIIFDFFGVIYSDPYNIWLQNHGYKKEGEFLDVSQRMDLGYISLETFFNILGSLSSQPPELIVKEFKSAGKINYELLDILDNLKSHYKIGLLSNATTELIEKILKDNDLDKHFDEIIVSSEIGYIKPGKEIFDITLNRLGVSPSEALFIDDNKQNINGAENVGIRSFLFTDAKQLTKDLLILKAPLT